MTDTGIGSDQNRNLNTPRSMTMVSWNVTLNDEREILLRFLSPDDKECLLEMMNDLSERALQWSNPPYDEEKIGRWMNGVGTGLFLVAEYSRRIVGICAVYQFSRPREKDIGEMMIYIHQDFQSIGLGTLMTKRVISLAKDKGLHRIGLEVVEDNEGAVMLYKKCGFNIEGRLRDAYYGTDGVYHDVLLMGILLSET